MPIQAKTRDAKYNDYWRTDLPLVPAFNIYQRAGSNGMNYFTAFIYSDGRRDLVANAGLNYDSIFSFCGGCQVTALRVGGCPLADYWGNNRQTITKVLPRIEDFLGKDWHEEAGEVFSKVPNSVLGVGPRSTAAEFRRSMAKQIAMASVGALLYGVTGQYGQNIITFWDIKDGPTRNLLHWLWDLYRPGLHVDSNYAGTHVGMQMTDATRWWNDTGGEWEAHIREYTRIVPHPSGFLGEYVPVRSRSFRQGRYTFNRNSNRQVSCGNLVTKSSRNHRGARIVPEDAPAIQYRVHDDWRNMVKFRSHLSSAGIPQWWQPM